MTTTAELLKLRELARHGPASMVHFEWAQTAGGQSAASDAADCETETARLDHRTARYLVQPALNMGIEDRGHRKVGTKGRVS
jgi:hypothetical protein